MDYHTMPERDMEPPDGNIGFEIWCEKLEDEFWTLTGKLIDIDSAFPDLDKWDWFSRREWGAYNVAAELALQWANARKRYHDWLAAVDAECKRLADVSLYRFEEPYIKEEFDAGTSAEEAARAVLYNNDVEMKGD